MERLLASAFGLALAASVLVAPEALAKGHDQGIGNGFDPAAQDGVPGTNVGSETVGPAQGLGKGGGPTGSPGNSGDAGGPSGPGAGTDSE